MIRMKSLAGKLLSPAPRKQLNQQGARRGTTILGLALMMLLALPASVHAAESRAVKQKFAPVYPEIAKRMKVSGVVTVSATVSPDGSVKATKVVSGSGMLAGAAQDAVQRWKFASGPDESTVEVQVSFALAQ